MTKSSRFVIWNRTVSCDISREQAGGSRVPHASLPASHAVWLSAHFPQTLIWQVAPYVAPLIVFAYNMSSFYLAASLTLAIFYEGISSVSVQINAIKEGTALLNKVTVARVGTAARFM